ncbi:MAG TPA: FtsX-like permease family protein [Pirellulales bacterium]|nr:FtsX-like permease family protein [Pirellulales bacterium]
MSLWKIAWRSVQQRALASCLTGVSMALGVALVVTVLVIHSVVDRFFRQSSQGYDMIVGATKGGRLQLVLNTVYHLSQPVENLPYSFYKEFLKDGEHPGKFASLVDVAVPLCLGDSYEEFRVVGTTPAMFEVWAPYQKYEFADGRNFKQDGFFEGVIGSVVASTTGLKVGDEFQPTHGVEATEGSHKHDAFKVVGILKPTGTPNDRALFINMEGFYLLRGHAKEEEEGHGNSAEHHDAEDAHDDHAMHEEHGEHAHAEHGHEEHAHEEHARDDHAEGEHATEGKPHADHDHADHDHDHADHEHADEAHHDHDEHAMSDHDADHEHGEQEHADHEHADHEHGAAGHDHDHHHAHVPLPESQREVTAILVRSTTTNPLGSMNLRRMINKGNEAQAVLPAMEINSLLEMIVGNLRSLLLALSVLIVIVAGIGIMVSIYNSMSDRRRDIAVMRSLGARRSTVLSVILLESILLSLGGGVAGWLVGHGLIAAAGPWVLKHTGFAMTAWQFSTWEPALVPGLVLLASLVGYLPAMAAYRTDVAKALSAAP